MHDRIRKRTKDLTLCAMLCALGVVLMLLGSVIEVLDLSTAALASLLCIYAVIELGGHYPFMLWLGTSLLSLLLLPVKTPAVFYALFLGYYPILKAKLESRSKLLCILLKLLVFHVGLLLILLIFWAFFPSMLETTLGPWIYPVLYLLSVAVFLLYDLALTRLITAYLLRLRPRFHRKH